MFVAASSGCFGDIEFGDACHQLGELDFDKVEIWMSEESEHLKPSTVASDPERFVARYRELTRLTPVALCCEDHLDTTAFEGIVKTAKLLRVTQVTVPAATLGTPFNTEIDRLREMASIASRDGIRLSLKTKTGHLTEDPDTAVELCQSVKGLGITLDASYFICGPHRSRSYDQVFPFVFHTHLRDSMPDQLQVQIGLGQIDYGRMIGLLERENYNLALSVDLIPELTDKESRPLEMRKLRMLLETLL